MRSRSPTTTSQRIAVARVDAVAEQQFDGAADFGQQRVRLGFGGAARAQVDLDIAGGRQNGGHRVLVFLVDRRDQLVEIALAHAGDAQEQGADHLLGDDAREARQALALEHRLEFVRRAGQQHGHGAGFFEPLAGRGAAVVGQNVRAFDHEGLALVDLGHLALGGGEALLQPVGDLRCRRSACGRAPGRRPRG